MRRSEILTINLRKGSQNADGKGYGDLRCGLLIKNLPGLTNINLSISLNYVESNNLSDAVASSISQLCQLVQLDISSGLFY